MRARSIEKLPKFWVEKYETIEGVNELKTDIPICDHQETENPLFISPYSNLIPIEYLRTNNAEPYRYGISTKNVKKFKKDGIYSYSSILNYSAFKAMSSYPDPLPNTEILDALSNMKFDLNDELFRDALLDLSSFMQVDRYSRIRIHEITNSFLGNNRTGRISSRSYKGSVGFLTSLLKKEDNYNCHIMAVVLPENYMALKYKWLHSGIIDLSLVTILIDRELDSTSFWCTPYRNIYRTKLLPELKKMNVTVVKVPLSYIMENCFLQPYAFSSKNIIDRKEELNHVIDLFKLSINPNKEDSTEDDNEDIDDQENWGEGQDHWEEEENDFTIEVESTSISDINTLTF